MKRTLSSALLVTLLAALLGTNVSMAAPAPDPHYRFFNFEKKAEIAQWTPATDAGKPGKYALTLQTERVQTADLATAVPSTNSYAALTNLAGGTGSAHWMATTLQAQGNVVNVVFKAKRIAGCGRCQLIAYAGREMPTDLSQFQMIDLPLQERDTWTMQVFETYLDEVGSALAPDRIPESGTVVVALGYRNLDVAEPKQRVGFDNISIRVLDLTDSMK